MAWFALVPLAFGIFVLAFPKATWLLHAWGKRASGIVGIERTREWDAMRKLMGVVMIAMSVAMFLFLRDFRSEWEKSPRFPSAQDLPFETRRALDRELESKRRELLEDKANK